MQVIWKYTLLMQDRQTVSMPAHSEILSIQMQNDTLCMWAMVDPHDKSHQRTFEIIGTGIPISDLESEGLMRMHWATVQHNGLDWHVFELH